ncbi:hypothetical protein [Haloferula rosea]|uniref:Uncharacterized protein n=1 Tax=Haloferula rosea TaxID=490093 RepID=A0A934RH53_9BACT|nr:hypothetical protein [Haloferula rosea]MBK1828240.1 hypothetical protein [Haloferula rosea]
MRIIRRRVVIMIMRVVMTLAGTLDRHAADLCTQRLNQHTTAHSSDGAEKDEAGDQAMH